MPAVRQELFRAPGSSARKTTQPPSLKLSSRGNKAKQKPSAADTDEVTEKVEGVDFQKGAGERALEGAGLRQVPSEQLPEHQGQAAECLEKRIGEALRQEAAGLV